MHDEVLFAVSGDKVVRVQRYGLDELELQERPHLQEWVLAHPDVLAPGTSSLQFAALDCTARHTVRRAA